MPEEQRQLRQKQKDEEGTEENRLLFLLRFGCKNCGFYRYFRCVKDKGCVIIN